VILYLSVPIFGVHSCWQWTTRQIILFLNVPVSPLVVNSPFCCFSNVPVSSLCVNSPCQSRCIANNQLAIQIPTSNVSFSSLSIQHLHLDGSLMVGYQHDRGSGDQHSLRYVFFFPHSPPLLHWVTLCVAYFYIRCLSTLTVGDNPSYCRIHLRSHAQRAILPCTRDIVPHDSCLFFFLNAFGANYWPPDETRTNQ
jgi:hypothetical protein